MTKTKTRTLPPTAALESRQARMVEVRSEIAKLDGELIEANRAVAQAIAEGSDSEGLTQTRRELQLRLDDLHAALPELEGLVHEAQNRLSEAQARKARARYSEARRAELEAVTELQSAVVEVMLPALAAAHEAGRVAYAAGLDAKVEKAMHYKRRLSTRSGFLHTWLGDVVADFRVATPHQVRDLAERLSALLPPTQEQDTDGK